MGACVRVFLCKSGFPRIKDESKCHRLLLAHAESMNLESEIVAASGILSRRHNFLPIEHACTRARMSTLICPFETLDGTHGAMVPFIAKR